MKKDIFKKAQNKIAQLATKSELNQLSILDDIMCISKMSKNDRIFYEAYKKYGNRDHTWQDFKEMFHGDVKKMQTITKKWRSWDEINKNLSQKYNKIFNKFRILEADLLEACANHNIAPDYNKIARICNTTKHPENQQKYSDLIRAFKAYNDYSHYINHNILKVSKYYSNYQTPHPEIEQIEKQFDQERQKINSKDVDVLKRKYVKIVFNAFKLRNEQFVIGERIDTYSKIILEDPALLYTAKHFLMMNRQDKRKFADKILAKSAHIHGTPIQTTQSANMAAALIGKRGQCLPEEASITLDPLNLRLKDFLKLLAHEEAHSIDAFNPNYGLVGTNMMKWVNYNDDLFLIPFYKTNPTEVSSYGIDTKISSHLVKIIDQANENTSDRTNTIWAAFNKKFATKS